MNIQVEASVLQKDDRCIQPESVGSTSVSG